MSILMEYKKIRTEYPEFQDVFTQARQKLQQMGQQQWGLKFGGYLPGPEDFGETTWRPRFIKLGTNTAVESWEFNLGTGWKTAFNNEVLEDVAVSVAGWMFPNNQNKITAIQTWAAGNELPVINLDGWLESFEQPIVVFDEGYTIFQEKKLRLDVQSKTPGSKTIIPWGPCMAKKYILTKQEPS